MLNKIIFYPIVFCLLTFCSDYKAQRGQKIERVISLAPSITEIIYALDQQSKLAAVTDYCSYPTQAVAKESIGGLLDPNLEKIISLQPDILIGTKAHSELAFKLEARGLKTILLPNDSVDDIFLSIDSIGVILGCTRKAGQITKAIRDSIASYRTLSVGLDLQPAPAMLVLGREPATTRNIGVIGSHNYMDSLWTIMGGVNIFGDLSAKFAQVSRETIIDRNPELIIEFKIEDEWTKKQREANLKEWSDLNLIKAVQQNNIFVIPHKRALIPGPRIYLLAKDYMQILQARHEKN